jgi:hypothetical protein
VSNTLFIVNDTLELGHTTADAGHPSQAESGFGQLTVLNGGTVRANTITVGGMTKLSGANTITLTNSANLVVTNTIAAADKKLAALTMISSMLTLNVDGTNTSPYVYVTNLIAGGAGNVIRLASVTGVSSYPAQLALIGYESAAAGFSVIVPSGLFGYIVNNTANKTIDVILATNAPKTVVWRGNIDGNWNTTTLNWVDPLTLTATNFSQGDFVVFDDTATGATNISIIDSVVSGQHATLPGVLVSNSVRNYTFTGGTIAGTGKMLKQGSGTLSVDANSENSLTVSNGTVNVTAGGTVGSTTVAAGTAFTSSGTVNGLTSASFSSSAGTINGPVAIQAGTFVNSGTVDTTPGTMTIGAGALITNLSSGVLNVRVPTGNNWAVPTNAVLANFGRINNLSQRLNMNAGSLLYGIGVVGRGAGVTVDNGRLAINAGAVFSPGETPFHSLGVFTVEARLDVNQAGGGNPAGRLVIEIDMGHPMTNDVVAVDKWSNIRGTIVMTNIGTIPFAAGQSFHIVSNNFGFPNTPEVANLDYTIEPVVPGLGLAWDTSNLITNGVLSIKTLPSTSTNIMVSITTNLWELAWPAEYRGWRLQGQTNNIAIGISNNWGTVPNSHLTNRVFMRMNPANGAVFWRLIHP